MGLRSSRQTEGSCITTKNGAGQLAASSGAVFCAAQENAARLLARQRKDPTWHAAFLPYWRSLPAPGSSAIFCKELFTEHHIALLQDNEMVLTLSPWSSSDPQSM